MSKLFEIEELASGHKFFGDAYDAQEWIEAEYSSVTEDEDEEYASGWKEAVELACQYVENCEYDGGFVDYEQSEAFYDVLNLSIVSIRDSADYPDDGRIYAEVTLHDGCGGEKTIHVDGAPSVRAIQSKMYDSDWVSRRAGVDHLQWAEIDILDSESLELRDAPLVFSAWMWRDPKQGRCGATGGYATRSRRGVEWEIEHELGKFADDFDIEGIFDEMEERGIIIFKDGYEGGYFYRDELVKPVTPDEYVAREADEAEVTGEFWEIVQKHDIIGGAGPTRHIRHIIEAAKEEKGASLKVEAADGRASSAALSGHEGADCQGKPCHEPR